MDKLNVILLGAPGAGKGTHAEALKAAYGVEHISTGDMLRAAVAAGTELGREAKRYMDAGSLVPDEVVIGIVRERLLQDQPARVLFDGFPRTVAQAEALEKVSDEVGLPKALVIYLTVSDEEVIARLSGRRQCRGCKAIYNTRRDALEVGDACPACGEGEIYQRDDDQAEAIGQRLVVFRKQTAPLIDYYQQRGQLVEIKAEGDTVEAIAAAVVGAVSAHRG
ncbi:MAG TPA: adenylate kinase [Armatimonadota bacterium]